MRLLVETGGAGAFQDKYVVCRGESPSEMRGQYARDVRATKQQKKSLLTLNLDE
jgi:hypothetical protein